MNIKPSLRTTLHSTLVAQDIIDPFLALIKTAYRGDLPSTFMKSFENINYEASTSPNIYPNFGGKCK